MTGTNRKEMRKLLNKYIALMKVAFDNGINMELVGDAALSVIGEVRLLHVDPAGEPRTVVLVYLEPGVQLFTAYEWRDVEGNEEQLKAVEKFIEEHMK